MKTVSDQAEADESLKYGDLNNDGTLKSEGEAESGEGEETSEEEGSTEGEYEAAE